LAASGVAVNWRLNEAVTAGRAKFSATFNFGNVGEWPRYSGA